MLNIKEKKIYSVAIYLQSPGCLQDPCMELQPCRQIAVKKKKQNKRMFVRRLWYLALPSSKESLWHEAYTPQDPKRCIINSTVRRGKWEVPT